MVDGELELELGVICFAQELFWGHKGGYDHFNAPFSLRWATTKQLER
jgi:hypothetical protein